MEYRNRRRNHIHIIRQYNNESMEYTGTRLVIFLKKKGKLIYDFDDFKEHKYKNPKDKKNYKSKWKILPCSIKGIIKKTMTNCSEDEKYFMKHTIYESDKIDIKDYIDKVLLEENLNIKILNDIRKN